MLHRVVQSKVFSRSTYGRIDATSVVERLNFASHIELFNTFGAPECKVVRPCSERPCHLFRRFGSGERDLGVRRYFTQGVRINGFVGSSLVGFFSCLPVFFGFMSQFYAF
jgi:hypothetical protein